VMPLLSIALGAFAIDTEGEPLALVGLRRAPEVAPGSELV